MSWRERLHVSPSRMEQEVLIALDNRGVYPLTDKEFCVQSTKPDFYFPDQRLAVYLDGPTHLGKEERDEALRQLLSKRYGVKVLSIPYNRYSKSERGRIINAIMEALKT